MIRGVFRQSPGETAAIPAIRLHNCRNTLVADCIAVKETPVFVGMTGPRTEAIRVDTRGMEGATQAVSSSDKEYSDGD